MAPVTGASKRVFPIHSITPPPEPNIHMLFARGLVPRSWKCFVAQVPRVAPSPPWEKELGIGPSNPGCHEYSQNLSGKDPGQIVDQLGEVVMEKASNSLESAMSPGSASASTQRVYYPPRHGSQLEVVVPGSWPRAERIYYPGHQTPMCRRPFHTHCSQALEWRDEFVGGKTSYAWRLGELAPSAESLSIAQA